MSKQLDLPGLSSTSEFGSRQWLRSIRSKIEPDLTQKVSQPTIQSLLFDQRVAKDMATDPSLSQRKRAYYRKQTRTLGSRLSKLIKAEKETKAIEKKKPSATKTLGS